MCRKAVAAQDGVRQDQEEPAARLEADSASTIGLAHQFDDLTRTFVRLSNLPTYPLDRLSRYEVTLWRQACQILFTLQCLSLRQPMELN
jgi:hypothetical protein